ncbi:MAG: single-stranded DNA-binding protein [Bifidobacteriaceae bacterium]|jgi:single-strand DNA-binding protein|nr:single-stranded DNA-binding protein [Bifidobacteriaceae bacterium]
MAFNSSVVVRGYLGTDPKKFGNGNVQGSSFRLAVPRGFYDHRASQWRDQPTTWISVRAFRSLGTNIAACLHKGDPVVVVGEMATDEWSGDDGTRRTSLILQANIVGYDLNQGIGSFVKTRSATAVTASYQQTQPSQQTQQDHAQSQESAPSRVQQQSVPHNPVESGFDGFADGSTLSSANGELHDHDAEIIKKMEETIETEENMKEAVPV